MRLYKLFIICAVLVLFLLPASSHAASLEGRGLSSDVLDILNPACKDVLGTDFLKTHSYWNSLWSKEGKLVSLDFLQGTKHFSFSLLPLDDGSCQTSRTITAYWTMECSELASRYMEELRKGIAWTKEEQKTFLWMTTGKGTDIYMYKVPWGCVEIFKEFYKKQLP